jgi:hypothetical protein
MPGVECNARIKLNKLTEENSSWRQKRAKGKGFEYHIDCLPPETRAHLLAQQMKGLKANQIGSQLQTTNEELWFNFQQASEHKRQAAQVRYQAFCSALTLAEQQGISMVKALAHVAPQTPFSFAALKKLYYTKPGLRAIAKADWLAALIDDAGTNTKHQADISPEAWAFFQGDWLRTDKPTIRACYERLIDSAP